MKRYPDNFSQMLSTAGAFLADWRKEQGLTQFELAEIAGCHQNSIQNIEHGTSDVQFTVFSRICVQLACPGIQLDAYAWRLLKPNGTFDGASLAPVLLRPSVMVAQVGARVHALRQGAGVSMREVAARASVHPNTLWNLERGLCDPSLSTLYRVFRAMGVSCVAVGNEGLVLR